MFFVRSGPSASAPLVKGIQGTYTWEAVVPGASGVPREVGSFSAVASGDAGGRMTWENTAHGRAHRGPPSRRTTLRAA